MNCFETGKCILNKLIEKNFEAYFVGGFVRDHILKIESNDIDITTNASPSQIKEIFHITKETGIEYNSIIIVENGFEFEITTFRQDVEYIDNRHPIISHATTLKEDLKRRDFTINSLAMDADGNIIDEFGGLLDIKNKVIKTVGDPNIKFKEDSLRILRAIYLVSKLNFDIEEETYKAMYENRVLISNLSNFRIKEELSKMIKYNSNNKYLDYLIKCEIACLFPGLNEGINYIYNNDIILKEEMNFYGICFYHEKDSIDFWQFKKEFKKELEKLLNLVEKNITKYDMFLNGENVIAKSIKLKQLLNIESMEIDELKMMVKTMPIRKTSDIDFNFGQLSEVVKNQDNKWYKNIKKKICIEIIEKRLDNKKEDIISYIKKEVLHG